MFYPDFCLQRRWTTFRSACNRLSRLQRPEFTDEWRETASSYCRSSYSAYVRVNHRGWLPNIFSSLLKNDNLCQSVSQFAVPQWTRNSVGMLFRMTVMCCGTVCKPVKTARGVQSADCMMHSAYPPDSSAVAWGDTQHGTQYLDYLSSSLHSAEMQRQRQRIAREMTMQIILYLAPDWYVRFASRLAATAGWR